MTFFIEKNYAKGDIYIESIEGIKILESLSLKGKSIKTVKEKPLLVFKNSTGKKTDFLTGGTVLYIVSLKVKELLLESISDSNIEFLNFANNNDYVVLNLINSISCFDWNNSIYTRYPETMKELINYPETIDKLVLNQDLINGKDLFKMTEDPRELFFSENLKKLFETNNISGVDFKSIDEFEKW